MLLDAREAVVPLDDTEARRLLGVLHDVPVERLAVLLVRGRGLGELGAERRLLALRPLASAFRTSRDAECWDGLRERTGWAVKKTTIVWTMAEDVRGENEGGDERCAWQMWWWSFMTMEDPDLWPVRRWPSSRPRPGTHRGKSTGRR